MASTLALITERNRQIAANDSDFLKKRLYFFELRIPKNIAVKLGGFGELLFPLVLNPQSYSMDEPFTVEATPTQGGGLFVEENGIIQRMIRISGTTGFKPRKLPRTTGASAIKALGNTQVEKSYSRSLTQVVDVALSGQRHFQYLQDAVFRTYADFKRDPSTSEETHLIFHNQKDDEHWVVAPQKFSLQRSKDSRVTYQYSIELLVVDKADGLILDVTEDKGWLDAVKDAQRFIKSGVDLCTGALNDITALTAELEVMIQDWAKIIDGVATAVDAGSNFVTGAVNLIESPISALESTNNLISAANSAREVIEENDDIRKIPSSVRNKFRQMEDGLERLMSHPSVFETPAQKRMRELKERQELLLSAGNSTIQSALATAPPSTLNDVESQGTGITQGEAISAEADLGVGRATRDYTSTTEYTLTQGDTLVNLAARFLGDARLWQDIAIINGLKPPFANDLASTPLVGTDETPLDGALGRGGKILIPNFSQPPEALSQIPVLGVRLEKSAEEHLLGTDFALEATSTSRAGSPQYDIPIDTDRGSVDVKTVSGLANMKQVLRTRITAERGTDPLYQNLGMRRVVGLNLAPVDLEVARYRVNESLIQDPRIRSVRALFLENNDDVLEIDATVELRGYTENSNIKTTL